MSVILSVADNAFSLSNTISFLLVCIIVYLILFGDDFLDGWTADVVHAPTGCRIGSWAQEP
jgi:hypothetical protein